MKVLCLGGGTKVFTDEHHECKNLPKNIVNVKNYRRHHLPTATENFRLTVKKPPTNLTIVRQEKTSQATDQWYSGSPLLTEWLRCLPILGEGSSPTPSPVVPPLSIKIIGGLWILFSYTFLLAFQWCSWFFDPTAEWGRLPKIVNVKSVQNNFIENY